VIMEKVTKKFGEFKANDNVNLEVKQGEIHAILGENGAGKSTLMNSLFGLYEIDEGQISINGQVETITSPIKAQQLGIGMVHQHFMLVKTFSVLQNIILGNEPTKLGKLTLKDSSVKLQELDSKFHFNLDINAKVSSLTVGQEQKIEILKVLYKDANIIIFDEPTAVLTPQETEEFLNIMRKLKQEGKTIILITHKLNEIKAVADNCTIIRKGQTIATVKVSEINENELANMMVGKTIDLQVAKAPAQELGNILKIKNLNYQNEAKIQKIKNINLDIKKGKILGIAGVDNNGQKELINCITGVIKPTSGEVMYVKDGQETNLVKKAIKDINKQIISYIPEDRLEEGLIGEYNLAENSVLIQYKTKEFAKLGLLNKSAIAEHATKILKKYDVRSSKGILNKANELSGGNQQKLIIGRQVELDADILVAYQPTRGVDVGAIKAIHEQLVKQRDLGKTIILISMELNEVMSLSDEIAVIHDGEIIDKVDALGITKEEIGLMMAGKKVKNAK
ncbi:MAG: ABC transporter ATP-binding protein, partial [Mycoplasmatales bacterium]